MRRSTGPKGSALRGARGCPPQNNLWGRVGGKVDARVCRRSWKAAWLRLGSPGLALGATHRRFEGQRPSRWRGAAPRRQRLGRAGGKSAPAFVASLRGPAWLGQGSPGRALGASLQGFEAQGPFAWAQGCPPQTTLGSGGRESRRPPRSPTARSVPPYRGIIRRTESGLPGPSIAWRLRL